MTPIVADTSDSDICPHRNLAQRIASNLVHSATPAIASLGLLASGVAQAQMGGLDYTVDTTVDSLAADGFCSLREAIEVVSNPGAPRADCVGVPNMAVSDQILFDASISGQTITLGGTQLPNILRSVSIIGPVEGDPSSITIDADNRSRVMRSYGYLTPADVQLSNLTLTNGNTGSNMNGGGIETLYGSLTLTDCVVTGNTAGRSGGGIFGNYDVRLERTLVSDNRLAANSNGGGGLFVSGNLYANNSIISGNSAPANIAPGNFGHGGGASVFGNTSLNRTVISGNITGGEGANGGGLYAQGNVIAYYSAITDNITSGNQAHGGGIFVDGYGGGNDLILFSTVVSGNEVQGAGSHGGGVFFDGVRGSSRLSVQSTTIADNRATGRGGGVYARYSNHYNSRSSISYSTISGNEANDGGGIFATYAYLDVTNSTISGNSAAQGAGLCTTSSGNVVMNHSTVANNTSSGVGINQMNAIAGGVNMDAGDLSISNTIVAYNNPADCAVNGGTFVATTSLDEDGSCRAMHGGFTTSGNINLNPTLALNGGRTETHALIPPSDAIDQVPVTVMSDQRGVSRPLGGGEGGSMSDIGAVEYNNNGVLGFTQIGFAEFEDRGPEVVSVRRSDGTSGAVSVDVRIRQDRGDRAQPIIDYDVPGAVFDVDDDDHVLTLNWANGEGGIKSFNVDLVDDNINEGLAETTTMGLQNGTGGVSLTNTLVKLGILDPAAAAAVEAFFRGEDDRDGSFFSGATGPFELFLLLPLALLGLGRKLKAVLKGRNQD